jgi:hypothetical protein
VRRALAVAAVALVAAAGLVALVAAFNARDDAGVATPPAAGPGELHPDRGAEHGARAEPGGLPTSGEHRADLVTRDRAELTNDQLLHALELGNVVLAYGSERPPAELVRVQRQVAGPFDAEVAAAGQAVVLMHRPGLDAPVGLAWRRELRGDASRLRNFADAWLGRGA